MPKPSNKLYTYTGDAKTKRNKARVLSVLADNGANITAACLKINIARKTFYNWLEDDEDFNQAHTDIREQMLDGVENVLWSKVYDAERDSDQIRAAEIILKARGKNRGYGVEKREQEHSGEIETTPVKLNLYLPDNGRAAKIDD